MRTETAGINELFLHGCILRNTQWMVGLVVYTGQDKKIMMNRGAAPSKRIRIDRETGFNVIGEWTLALTTLADVWL